MTSINFIRYYFILTIIVILLSLTACGKKGPVRPINSPAPAPEKCCN